MQSSLHEQYRPLRWNDKFMRNIPALSLIVKGVARTWPEARSERTPYLQQNRSAGTRLLARQPVTNGDGDRSLHAQP